MHFKIMEGLPAPIEQALKASVFEYSEERRKFLERFKGQYDEEFSVTDLPRAEKQLWLTRKFKDDLVIDLVRDNYHSLLGSVFHFILQRYAPAHCIVEERQHTIINVDGVRVLIHGQPDLYDPFYKKLSDYKFTSGWSVLYDKYEYEFQLNANKWLFENRGIEVEKIENIYCFRQLDKDAQLKNPKYPKENIQIKSYVPWSRQKTEEEIMKNVRRLLKHKKTKWKELPDCSDKDRWIRDSYWRVLKRKKGTKREPKQDWGKNAVAVFDTKKEAVKHIAETEYTEEVKLEKRVGTPKKCIEYCLLVPWCLQRQNELKEKEKKVLLDA